MANVGNLSATLSLSAFEFNSGLKQSETAAMQFATTVETQSRRADAAMSRMSSRQLGGGKSNTALLFQQAGQAAQDFTSQIERGIGPAIGAITNNIQQMGALLGPAAGAYIAIGAVVGSQVIPPMMDWLYQTKQIAEAAKEAESQFAMMAKSREEMAALEVKGGAGEQRKNLEEQLAIAERLKGQVFAAATQAKNNEMVARKALKDIAFEPMTGVYVPRNIFSHDVYDAEKKLNEAKAKTKLAEDEAKRVLGMETGARDKLNQLGPQSAAVQKDEWMKANKEALDAADKQLADRDRLEASLKMKSLENYGTAEQRALSKIERERTEMMRLRVDEESRLRFESQSTLELMKAKITDKEKSLLEMGSPAGMSSGALRGSAEGVRAINRAMAGTQSEQSMAKEQVTQLKRLVQLGEQEARKAKPVIKQVSLLG